MAALFQPADNSEHATPRELESFIEETLDQSGDVILVVEDGKEFKAHKRVLSEASPFFEKMLSSDMKESKEGMVRLEMFSESAMRNTLEFIYTGSVQILAEHNARDLIVIADYLFLENLKTLAEEVLLQTLNTLNCIPAYYVAQRYRCEGLFAKTKTFILAHFTAVCEANPEEVLNMSSKEIEMFISSDEIDVSAEEDVFRIILAWINHDKSKRKKYFAELFHQVRLVYVSRDFLCSDIVTNDLVKDNEDCLDLVEDAMRLIDSEDFDNLSVSPRKSLETPVIVTCTKFTEFDGNLFEFPQGNFCESHCVVNDLQCYLPREDRWCRLGEFGPIYTFEENVSCGGKLYRIGAFSNHLTSYNLYSNSCIPLPAFKEDWNFVEIFVSNQDEMYALMYVYDERYLTYITKYKPESDSWETLSIFDKSDVRKDLSRFCIVAKDNFIYYIGGSDKVFPTFPLTDVHRYDIGGNQWDQVTYMQQPKIHPCGAVANGKIFVAGIEYLSRECQCEVYNETTDEWQFIAGFNLIPSGCPKLLSVNGTLWRTGYSDLKVECYDPDKNEWHYKTEISSRGSLHCIEPRTNAYSVKIFQGFLNRQLKSFPKSENAMPTSRHLVKQHRDEVDEWLSEDPPLFLSRPYQGYRLQLVQAPTSRCHLVNQRRDEVDGGARIIKIDAIPPAPGSSASGDESLNEESVDLEIAPAPARSTKRKCCFIL